MAMDDTRVRKTGTKADGVKYMRDPMGPPFRVNFLRLRNKQSLVGYPMSCSFSFTGKNEPTEDTTPQSATFYAQTFS